MTKQFWRIVSLFILAFEGFGIRMLDGVIPSPISFWTLILLIINFDSIRRMSFKNWGMILGIIVFYTFFCVLKGVTPRVFLYAGWFSAFFVLSNYVNGRNDFVDDMFRFTKYCVYYSLLHIPIVLFASSSLSDVDYGLHMKTFYHLLYYSNDNMNILGLYRTSGFCWEPSCWNCLLNLNLALSLVLNKKREVILSVIAIFFVFSTTGFLVMLAVFATYFVLYQRKTNIRIIALIGLILVLVAPIAIDNYSEKIKSGSGATRFGDFFVAGYVIKNSPFLGDDLDNITSNTGAMKAKSDNWGLDAHAIVLYEEVGMTNAFAALFVEWGLFVTFFVIYLMFTSPLFPDKKMAILYSVTMLLVLMGTPIARTGFFYMLPMAGLMLSKRSQRIYHQLSRKNNIILEK